MKICIYILRISICLLLLSFGLYFYFYCIGEDGLDPIEAETIGIAIYTALGVAFAFLLSRRAAAMRRLWFIFDFILYLLIWSFPSIVINSYLLLMMTAG